MGVRLRRVSPPEDFPPFSTRPCLRRSESAPRCEAVRACFRSEGVFFHFPAISSAPSSLLARATCRAPATPGRRGHPAPGPGDLLLHGHHYKV